MYVLFLEIFVSEHLLLGFLEKITNMAVAGAKLGLGVSAGHGLNYQNVTAIAKIPQVEELNIGHSIVSRAVLVGMERAVREMLDLIR